MAAPNLREPTTVTGKTFGYAVTTTLADVLVNAAASGKVLKINAVYCANVVGGAGCAVTLVLTRGGVDRRLAKDIVVPAAATQVLVAREAYIYLEEGDSLRAQAANPSELEMVVSYEDIS
jgi:hypothetical protein